MLWWWPVGSQKNNLKTLPVTACIFWCVKAGAGHSERSLKFNFGVFVLQKKISTCLMGLEVFCLSHNRISWYGQDLGKLDWQKTSLYSFFLKGSFFHSNFYSICVNNCLMKVPVLDLQFNCTASLKQLKAILRAVTSSGIDLRKFLLHGKYV